MTEQREGDRYTYYALVDTRGSGSIRLVGRCMFSDLGEQERAYEGEEMYLAVHELNAPTYDIGKLALNGDFIPIWADTGEIAVMDLAESMRLNEECRPAVSKLEQLRAAGERIEGD